MNCLNKHSAQLEEVWLGRSRFYIYMEVTSYTNWKTRELVCIFHGRTTNGSLQLFSKLIFKRFCETAKSSHTKSLFQSYLYSMCASPLKRRLSCVIKIRGEKIDGRYWYGAPVVQGLFPTAMRMGSIHAPLPPSHPQKKKSVTRSTTYIFLAMQIHLRSMF